MPEDLILRNSSASLHMEIRVLEYEVNLKCFKTTLALGGCGKTATRQEATSDDPGARDKAVTGDGVLFIGLMVHLEGWKDETTNQERFRMHAAQLRRYAALFEKYGAKLTLEASPEFVQGCINWGDNVLKEMHDRGHGVGVHADLSGGPDWTQERLTSELKEQADQALR